MRISGIFILFVLSLTFENAFAWWAVAARGIEPIILSFGAVFAAFGLNDQPRHDVKLFNVKELFINKFSWSEEKKAKYKE